MGGQSASELAQGGPLAPRRTGRKMSPQEKAEIRTEYLAIPEPERTKEVRATLAPKYDCKPMQIYGLSRDMRAVWNGNCVSRLRLEPASPA
jgi:hypothetical protein